MATVKIVIKKNKEGKNGEFPLYLRITKNRVSRFMSLGYTILPEHWNETKQCVRKSYPEHERFNKYLAIKKAEATGKAATKEAGSKYAPAKTLKQEILGRSSMSFFQFAEKYLGSLERSGKVLTYNKKKGLINKLKEYVGNHILTFDDIDVHFLTKYAEYLRDKKNNKPNSIHTDLKNIRAIIKRAILEDEIPVEKNPFLKYKLKTVPTKKEYLTEAELEAIEKLKLDPKTVRFHHRNIYVFSCYAGGLRISDIFRLKWQNFDGERIVLDTQKATNTVSIKLPDKALQIINLYKTQESQQSDYIFPFLKNDVDYSDLKFYYRTTSSLTAATNNDLRDIATMAGITKHIHFHTARHTFATLALKKGIRVEYVSKLLGHTDIKTTQIYAKIVNEELDKAMDVFNKK